jgi:hypothetical protein
MSRYFRLNIVIEINEYPVVQFNPDNFQTEVDEKGNTVVSPGVNFSEFMEREIKFLPHLSTCEEVTERDVELNLETVPAWVCI